MMYGTDNPSSRGRGRGRGGRGPQADFGGFPFGGGRGGLRRGPRARRGAVRAALLALLAEEPQHGYQLMQQLTERTNGVWRPSPGSVYPTLQQLEDEGLVTAVEANGRKVFHLTDAGRAETEARTGPSPWDEVLSGTSRRDLDFRGLVVAAHQINVAGTPAQQEAAQKILADAQRALYLLLAEQPAE